MFFVVGGSAIFRTLFADAKDKSLPIAHLSLVAVGEIAGFFSILQSSFFFFSFVSLSTLILSPFFFIYFLLLYHIAVPHSSVSERWNLR